MDKKKIIFINNHFQKSDGTVRVLINLCNLLDTAKYDITILPLYRCDMSLVSLLNPDIKVKRVFGFYFKGLSKILHILPISLLYKLFINYKYDIEIAFQCDIPTKLVGYKIRKNKVQVAWMHGYKNYPRYYKNLDKVVCVSRYNAERCISELPYHCDVIFMHNPIDDIWIKKLSQESTSVIRDSRITFISVGRLSPEKGYLRLLTVLSNLKLKGYLFRMLLVGDGPIRNEILSALSKLHLEDCVFPLGHQDNPYKFLKQSNLYICSSFSEGYSTSCVEAAILGVPIITTNVPGAQEIIDLCGCGIVCDLDDNSLEESIESVLKNPSYLNEWKHHLSLTSEKFSYANSKQQVTELFQEFSRLAEQRTDN